MVWWRRKNTWKKNLLLVWASCICANKRKRACTGAVSDCRMHRVKSICWLDALISDRRPQPLQKKSPTYMITIVPPLSVYIFYYCIYLGGALHVIVSKWRLKQPSGSSYLLCLCELELGTRTQPWDWTESALGCWDTSQALLILQEGYTCH